MAIGNQSSKICQMPSTDSIVMVTLLPSSIKNCNCSQKWLDEQRQTKRELLTNVLQCVLQPFPIIQNPCTVSRYYNVLRADGNFRCWTLVLAAWLAVGTKYSDVHHLDWHICFSCECPRTNLEVMSLLQSNTPGRITTYIGCSAMPTPRQPMPNSRCTMSTKDSTCINIYPVLWATSRSQTSSIQCRSVCWATSRSGFSTSGRYTNGSTSTMQSGYPCLPTRTSHQKISHMRKFLSGLGRRWRKWAGTCLEL